MGCFSIAYHSRALLLKHFKEFDCNDMSSGNGRNMKQW